MEGALVNDFLRISIETSLGNFNLKADITGDKEIIVLFGPSGSGKSTILNCVTGLQRIDRGEILLGERHFVSSERSVLLAPQKRRCGYLPQNPSLFPHMTVAQNICFALSKETKLTQEKRLTELLSIFRLEGFEKARVSELSGGQAKRAALARALAAPPDILLLDEPFSALDDDLREELALEIKNIQRELNIPLLLVTHSKQEALLIADKVVVLKRGCTIAQGSPEDMLGKKDISERSQFSW